MGYQKKGWIQRAYEKFLGLPVPVVIALLWLAGFVVLSLCALVLYLYGSALVRMVLGA